MGAKLDGDTTVTAPAGLGSSQFALVVAFSWGRVCVQWQGTSPPLLFLLLTPNALHCTAMTLPLGLVVGSWIRYVLL